MARPTLGKNDMALIEALVALKPTTDHRKRDELPKKPTVMRMVKKSEDAKKFFTEINLQTNPSARAFTQQMQIFEKALIESYKAVKGPTSKFRMNFGNTTEAVLLYGMNLTNLFRYDVFNPAYLGGDVELEDPDSATFLGVQIKAPGGVTRISYNASKNVLQSMVAKYGHTLDERALRDALTAVIANSKIEFLPSGDKVADMVEIARRYAMLSINTKYIMLRASTSNYFFVTMKTEEFPLFVQDNPHLFALQATRKNSRLAGFFPKEIRFKGIENDTDLWRIGQQQNFLAIHFPIPSYFYQTRGTSRNGQVVPEPPASGYGVGEIRKYNEHISNRGAEFEMVHNGFFGSYGKVKAKY